MTAASVAELMTTDQLLALPENGVDRWLIDGELREKPMTVRNRKHSFLTARVSYFLNVWVESQPKPHGKVLAGEAGVKLTRNPDTTVGIDVVYISAELAARQTDDTRLVDGVPLLAVEILSPSDTHEEVSEKIRAYLSAGVALVWIIDPDLRTVTAHRPNDAPTFFNDRHELTGEPSLPGFRVPVRNLFE